jgi:hypothetical protein
MTDDWITRQSVSPECIRRFLSERGISLRAEEDNERRNRAIVEWIGDGYAAEFTRLYKHSIDIGELYRQIMENVRQRKARAAEFSEASLDYVGL